MSEPLQLLALVGATILAPAITWWIKRRRQLSGLAVPLNGAAALLLHAVGWAVWSRQPGELVAYLVAGLASAWVGSAGVALARKAGGDG
jgi:hypothetical protein